MHYAQSSTLTTLVPALLQPFTNKPPRTLLTLIEPPIILFCTISATILTPNVRHSSCVFEGTIVNPLLSKPCGRPNLFPVINCITPSWLSIPYHLSYRPVTTLPSIVPRTCILLTAELIKVQEPQQCLDIAQASPSFCKEFRQGHHFCSCK